MKFPGKRKSKHYFPVNARDPLLQQFQPENETSAAWVVGIDQTLVDIEAKVDDEFIERYGLSAGHSLVIEDDVAEALYQELKQKNLITPCTTTRCSRTTVRCYWASCAAILKLAAMPIVTCVIPPAVPILTIYKAWMARLVVALR